MARWLTEYEDQGKSYLSEIQAESFREAAAYAIRRGLGERLLQPTEELACRPSAPRPSARLEAFLREPSVPGAFAALRAVNGLAHLAARANLRLDARGMLGDSGPLQLAVRLVTLVLEQRDAAEGPIALEKLREEVLAQLRHLEAQVPGLPD